MPSAKAPYAQLDPPIRALVRVLNSFAGITTIGSCGGHAVPANPSQAAADEWWITFSVDRSEDGWFALEWLAWCVRDCARAGGPVDLTPTAPPPWLNTPGQGLRFQLDGYQQDPDALAAHIRRLKRETFVTPAQWRRAG